jgi:hypothetical protein
MERKWLYFSAAAVILVGLVGWELWINVVHPLYKIDSINLPNEKPVSSGIYNYVKDGVVIGTYRQKTESGTATDLASFLITSVVDVQTDGKSFEVETRLTVNSFNTPITYFVNATLDDSISSIRVKPFDKTYKIENIVNGELFSTQVEPTNPVFIVDNNVPAHWELIINGAKMVPGERYGLSALVPQLNGVKEYELSIDQNLSSITVAGIEYKCKVVRENSSDLIFYFSDGKLILFRNQPLNLEISLKLS